ncbi:MAG: GNAT family N-acetyltransferase, partial [Actinomycetota bacterium]|nr:GNAT family N-acetyltransferase [Actinomycetota bacterium]
EQGLPAYLEASSPRNRALYERHGFSVTEELKLPRNGPPLWLMWRDPR